jgi:spore germination protein GerM
MKKIRRSGCIWGIIILAGAGLGCYLYNLPAASPVRRAAVAEKGTVSVYFTNEKGRLQRKTVEGAKPLSDKERTEILLRELKEARSIPDRLKVYELAVGEDGVLCLNLSKEFLDADSPAREVSMVYSIVNSFAASFPGVRSVQLLVEGTPVYTRSGFLYILKPLQFNRELLED